MPDRRIALVLAAAALVAWGISLGAETQDEQFLHRNIEEAKAYYDSTQAAGNLVLLTGLLVAAGLTAAVMTLAPRIDRGSWRWAGLFFLGGWGIVVLGQSSFPHVVSILEARQAIISIAPAMVQADALASVMLPVFALMLLILMLAGFSFQRIFRDPRQRPDGWQGTRQRYLGALVVAVPFLAVAAGGSLRLMFLLPQERNELALQYILSPVAALAVIGIAVLGILRCTSLTTLSNRPHLAPVVRENWLIMDRITTILYGAVGLTILASTALPTLQVDALSASSVFGLSLRSHGQAMVFLAVPLLFMARQERIIGRRLLAHGPEPDHMGDAPMGAVRTAEDIAETVLLALALVAGAVASLIVVETLTPWLLAGIPCAVVVLWRCAPRMAVPGTMVTALALWGMGNTVVATFDGSESPPLALADPPGILALWRFLGALVLGLAAGRIALHAGRHERRAVAVPLAALIGAGTTLVPLLQGSFSIWVITSQLGDAVALGNLIVAQDLSVRIIMHFISSGLILGAAAAAARLLRPDWFQRRGTGVAAPSPAGVPA